MTTKICNAICFLTGLGLLFIGIRFFLVPVSAETNYGLQLDTHGDFSFHYIKGIRDCFSGALVLLLLLMKERRALGIALLAASIIPVTDMLIVLSKSYNSFSLAIPHLIAVLICIIVGPLLLFRRCCSLPKGSSKKEGLTSY